MATPAEGPAPGRGLVIAAAVLIIIGGLITVAMSYTLNVLSSNMTLVTNFTKALTSEYPQLALTGLNATSLAPVFREVSYVLMAFGLIVIFLGILAFPMVYLPASRGFPDRAASWALPLGILYIVLGFIGGYIIFGIIAGILMLVAWHRIRGFAREAAIAQQGQANVA